MSEVFGTRHVLRQAKKGTGWWCNHHENPIFPIWVKVQDAIYPACQECFMEELIANQLDLYEAIECENSDTMDENSVVELSEDSADMIPLL